MLNLGECGTQLCTETRDKLQFGLQLQFFLINLTPNGIQLCSNSKQKQSSQSYSIKFEWIIKSSILIFLNQSSTEFVLTIESSTDLVLDRTFNTDLVHLFLFLNLVPTTRGVLF